MNNLPQGVEKISVTQKREHMAMVTTETDVASLRKQLAWYSAQSIREQLQQQRVEAEDLSAFGRGYRIREDRFSYSFNPTLSQSLGGPEDFYMFQLGLMSKCPLLVLPTTCCLMAVFSPIFTTTTTSLSLRCCPRTLPCPRARISVITFAMTFISTTCRRTTLPT